jgi:Tfp pilus assembly protein PilX
MRPHQHGAALIIVLIALAALVFAAAALMRSSEDAAAIAANLAFKQAATQAADLAIQSGAVRLSGMTDYDTDIAGVYKASQLTVSDNGLPNIDWTTIPRQTVGNFNVQFIIERMCTGALPVTNVVAQCATATPNGQAASHKVGAPGYIPLAGVFYRVTARVSGPKNSESYVQALLTK